MNTTIDTYLAGIGTGIARKYKNLCMVPLTSSHRDDLDYLLLDEALEEGVLLITEMDEGGSVPELRVHNKSERMVLILDGEELVGAKQNRIVNTTILLAAKSETIMPVSCVEQGRWDHKSHTFASEKRLSPSLLRAKKAEQVFYSARQSHSFRADQNEIWDDISRRQYRRGVASPTGEMAELYRQDKNKLNAFIDYFQPVPEQSGAIFFINGRLVGLDSFGKPEILTRVLAKLVESYAMDALDSYDPEREILVETDRAGEFLKQCRTCEVEERPSVALGTDCRLSADDLIGAGLTFQDRTLHLSIFATGPEMDDTRPQSRMSPMSRRRGFHQR